MRELNSVEVDAVAGGDDALLMYAILLMPPEKQERAITGLIVGHLSVLSAIASGGLSALALSYAVKSTAYIVTGGLLGAVAGGAAAFYYSSDYLMPKTSA